MGEMEKLDELLSRELKIRDPQEELYNVIVEFKKVAMVTALENLGIQVTGGSRILPLVYAKATRDQILKLREDDDVKMIHLSGTVETFQEFGALPSFDNYSQYAETFLEDSVSIINADKVHSIGFTGKGVNVGILDTGINSNHPWLRGRVKLKIKVASGDIEDGNGHGTHCAGIISKVAPDCNIVNIKVLDDEGSGTFSDIMSGIELGHANGVDIFSMSFGAYVECSDSNILMKFIDTLADKGKLCVCAAGNAGPGTNPALPAMARHAISVGATDKMDEIADFSSRGPACNRIYPLCMAPGVGIVSSWMDGGTRSLSGTSMSSPHVAGFVALLYEKIGRNPSITEMKKILELSSMDLSTEGIDNNSGYGRIDCLKAINAVKQDVPDGVKPNINSMIVPGLILGGAGLAYLLGKK